MKLPGYPQAVLAAILSGALLFASDHPFTLWWLQLVAFVPLLWGLAKSGRMTWTVGLLFSVAYALLLMLFAGQSPPVLIAAAVIVLQWTVLAPWLRRAMLGPAVLGPARAAALVTLFEFFVWHFVPVFGSGQCFARPLANAPSLVAFASCIGLAGVVVALILVQGLVVTALRTRTRRPLVVAGGFVLGLGALDIACAPVALDTSVCVAAMGHRGGRPALRDVFASAAEVGAQLLVTPETAYDFPDQAAAEAVIAALAREHGMAAVIGAWVREGPNNRSLLIDAAGRLAGSYSKTHLVPVFEDYQAGDGTPVVASLAGAAVGTMICQDDNFTDIARGVGARGAQLLAIPTNDWPDVAAYHLENSIFRSIETGCALVRATSNGVSAFVAPGGRVLATVDQVEIGYSLTCHDVPLGTGTPSLHSRLADWPMFVLCLLVIMQGFRSRR